MSRDYKPQVQMIQVTCDEYNQHYMKHDTLGSLLGKKKKGKVEKMQKGSTLGLLILIN